MWSIRQTNAALDQKRENKLAKRLASWGTR